MAKTLTIGTIPTSKLKGWNAYSAKATALAEAIREASDAKDIIKNVLKANQKLMAKIGAEDIEYMDFKKEGDMVKVFIDLEKKAGTKGTRGRTGSVDDLSSMF